MNEVTGLIFDTRRLSLHDGPGIRTTVFLKGCPLRCLWCHNPESRSGSPEITFYKAKCIGCGWCAKACPIGLPISVEGWAHREECRTCGECVNACPSEALQMVGRVVTVSEVLEAVIRDKPFYQKSGGGVTLSGGEPFYQFEFSKSLLNACKDNGLHTAVETCGYCSWEKIEQIAASVDLFLYDIKVLDTAKHKDFCGVDNSIILDNARKLAESGAEIIYRAPIVPGLNDETDDLVRLGEFIRSLPGEQKLELLAYHHIGIGKYDALGMNRPLADIGPLNDLDKHSAVLSAMGVQLV